MISLRPILFPVFAALMLAGCGGLPASAPTSKELLQGGGSPENPFAGFLLVDVDAEVAKAMHASGTRVLSGSFGGSRPAWRSAIGVGDTLQISIYEASNSGLFGGGVGPVPGGSPGAGRQGLQPLVVDSDGAVIIPFAGRVPVAGATPNEAANRIANRLAGKAIEPQVLVTIVTNGANAVTVGGEVYKSGVIPLTPRGEKLLDVIAAAGGSRFPAYESFVQVTRGGRTARVLLQRIVQAPSENVYVRPGDQVYVMRSPQTFSVLGSAGKVNVYPFETTDVTVAEAVARGGGFVDTASDPGALFVFRFEPVHVVRRFKPDFDPGRPGKVPVAYRINLRQADGFFQAKAMPVQDKDVVLATNADGAQLLKLLQIVRGVTGAIGDIQQGTTR